LAGLFLHFNFCKPTSIMKKHSTLLLLSILGLGLVTSTAQPGGPGSSAGGPGSSAGGPGFGGATAKLFGEHQTFSATMDFEIADPTTKRTITMPGKMSFDAGMSRFEMNMADIKGTQMPPNAAAQLKAMGMDLTVSISRPDKKVTDIIYPGMQSYVEISIPDQAASTADADFKTEVTELGKETVDGHDCVKNKVVITDKAGTAHESTVWNATDLKKFPVKIETAEKGQKMVMHFREVAFTKPAASAFEVPDGLKKYSTMQEMMQAVMMKQMGGAAGRPTGK
jgi:hypothetical protein